MRTAKRLFRLPLGPRLSHEGQWEVLVGHFSRGRMIGSSFVCHPVILGLGGILPKPKG